VTRFSGERKVGGGTVKDLAPVEGVELGGGPKRTLGWGDPEKGKTFPQCCSKIWGGGKGNSGPERKRG